MLPASSELGARRTAESARRDAELKQGILRPLRLARACFGVATYCLVAMVWEGVSSSVLALPLGLVSLGVGLVAHQVYRVRYRRMEQNPATAHIPGQKKGWGRGETGKL